MSREAHNRAAFSRAQAAYDNMSPPEDGPAECGECGGCGKVPDSDNPCGDLIPCPWCEGAGWLDENGEPHDPHEAERARDDYYDMKREADLYP